MKTKNINKSSGQIPRGLLIFGGIIVVAIIISFIVIKVVTKPSEPISPPEGEEEEEEEEELVYEVEIGEVKFKLIEAKNIGNTLFGSESKYPQWQKDLTTTEKFIEVTIGAVNIGTEYIEEFHWSVDEIVDSEGRKFHYSRETDPWLPEKNQCGVLLKPGFSPRNCLKIYEVAKISTGLKIRVSLPKKAGLLEEEKEAFINLGL